MVPIFETPAKTVETNNPCKLSEVADRRHFWCLLYPQDESEAQRGFFFFFSETYRKWTFWQPTACMQTFVQDNHVYSARTRRACVVCTFRSPPRAQREKLVRLQRAEPSWMSSFDMSEKDLAKLGLSTPANRTPTAEGNWKANCGCLPGFCTWLRDVGNQNCEVILQGH